MIVLSEARVEQMNACSLDNRSNWRALMQYMTPIGIGYVNGRPCRFYKNKAGHYWYKEITESEMYRRC